MSKVISPIMTDGTGMAIAQAINHNTATQLAINTASYDADGTLLEVQDARTINETQYASLGEAVRAEVTRIDNEKAVQEETLENHADRISAVENKANTNATNISKANDNINRVDNKFTDVFRDITDTSYNNMETYLAEHYMDLVPNGLPCAVFSIKLNKGLLISGFASKKSPTNNDYIRGIYTSGETTCQFYINLGVVTTKKLALDGQ